MTLGNRSARMAPSVGGGAAMTQCNVRTTTGHARGDPLEATANHDAIADATPAQVTPAECSNGSSDETRSLSGTAGSQPPTRSSSGSPDGDPSKIGRYRIIRRLGQGGFGRVYLAHDDDLDRPVAIKVPNPERITRPEDVEAFLVEARILAKLDHPHIVPVYDVGRTEDGLCFVVSKLIEGQRPGGQDGAGTPVFPGFGGTGCHRRRRLALRPHPRAGPPGHQARQHPDRRIGQTLRGGLRARPQG